MKISCWIQLVWDLRKIQGDGRAAGLDQQGKSPFKPPYDSELYYDRQTGRVNIQGTLITKTWSCYLACVYLLKDKRTQHQRPACLAGWHFSSWKEVLGAEKMEMCDPQCRGLISMIDVFPKKIKWPISHPSKLPHLLLKSPFREVKVYCPQNKQPWLEAGSW